MSGNTFTLFSKIVLIEKISSAFMYYHFPDNISAEEGNTCVTFELKKGKNK